MVDLNCLLSYAARKHRNEGGEGKDTEEGSAIKLFLALMQGERDMIQSRYMLHSWGHKVHRRQRE
jgi:hypothetical protein